MVDEAEKLIGGERRVRKRGVKALVKGIGPNLNETVEIVVRYKVLGLKDLHGGRTSVVSIIKPFLNTGTIVSDSGT